MPDPWCPEVIPAPEPLGVAGWARAALRLVALSVLLVAGVLLLLPVRLVEGLLRARHRPVSPRITQAVSRIALPILGLSCRRHGRPMVHKGGVVANHASWLDIFALNAGQSVFFVAKSEVAQWPGIGLLARATGTVFIRRAPGDAKIQQALLESRLGAGHKLLFFPEGTSSDGSLVLPFKSTLFEAFFTPENAADLWVQPVSVLYRSPPGKPYWFYGWWGEMGFVSHLLKVCAAQRRGHVDVVYHPPLQVARYRGRKDLALACEKAVRAGHKALVDSTR